MYPSDRQKFESVSCHFVKGHYVTHRELKAAKNCFFSGTAVNI